MGGSFGNAPVIVAWVSVVKKKPENPSGISSIHGYRGLGLLICVFTLSRIWDLGRSLAQGERFNFSHEYMAISCLFIPLWEGVRKSQVSQHHADAS